MLQHKRCKFNTTSWRVPNFNFLNARISQAIVLESDLQGNYRRISMPNCYGKATMDFLFIAEIHICQQYQKFLGLHVMRPIYLFDFKRNWIFMPYFNKILAYEFHKAPSNGAELCHADVQTDRHDETNSRFTKTLRKRLQMYLCNKAWKSRLAQNKLFFFIFFIFFFSFFSFFSFFKRFTSASPKSLSSSRRRFRSCSRDMIILCGGWGRYWTS